VNAIYRIDSAGVITPFPLPANPDNPNGVRFLQGITVAGDGTVWFTDSGSANVTSQPSIGRLTPGGVVTLFPIGSAQSSPQGIVAAPDGSVWFVDRGRNLIGHFGVSGGFTTFPIPTPNSQPYGIVIGSDGNVWFTELGANRIGVVVLGPAAAAAIPAVGYLGLLALALALGVVGAIRLRG
jgi:virginiamycin B lyase